MFNINTCNFKLRSGRGTSIFFLIVRSFCMVDNLVSSFSSTIGTVHSRTENIRSASQDTALPKRSSRSGVKVRRGGREAAGRACIRQCPGDFESFALASPRMTSHYIATTSMRSFLYILLVSASHSSVEHHALKDSEERCIAQRSSASERFRILYVSCGRASRSANPPKSCRGCTTAPTKLYIHLIGPKDL